MCSFTDFSFRLFLLVLFSCGVKIRAVLDNKISIQAQTLIEQSLIESIKQESPHFFIVSKGVS